MVLSPLTVAVPLPGATNTVSVGLDGKVSLAVTLSTVVVPAVAVRVSLAATGLTATIAVDWAQLVGTAFSQTW